MKTLVAVTLLVATATAQVPYGLVPPAANQYNTYGGPFAPEFYGREQPRFRREPVMTNEAMMMNPMLTTQDYPQYQQQEAYPNSLLTLDEMSRTPLFQEYLSLPLFRQWLPSHSFQQFLASTTFQKYWTNPVFQQFFREPALFYKFVYPVFTPSQTQYLPEQELQQSQQQYYYYPKLQQMQVPQPINQIPVSHPINRMQAPPPMNQMQVPQPINHMQFPQPINQVQIPQPINRMQVPQPINQIPTDDYLPRDLDYYPDNSYYSRVPSVMYQNQVDNYGPAYESKPAAPVMYQNQVDNYGPVYESKPAAPVMYQNQVDNYEPTYYAKPATPVVYLIRPEGQYNPMNNWYNPQQNSAVSRRVEIPVRVLKVPGPRQQEKLDEQYLVEKILKALFLPALEAELAGEMQEDSGENESEMTSVQMTPPAATKAEYPGMRNIEDKEEDESMPTMQDFDQPEMKESEGKMEEEQAQTTEMKTEAPLIIEATTEKQEPTPEIIDIVKMITANKRFARFDKKATKLEKKEKLIGAEEKLINSNSDYYKYDTVNPGQDIVIVRKRSDDSYQTLGGDGIHSVPLTRDESSWSNFNQSPADIPQDFKGNDDDQTYSLAPKN